MSKKALIFDCFGVIISPVVSGWLDKNTDPSFDRKPLLERFDLDELTEDGLALELSNMVKRSPLVIREEIDQNFSFNTELVEYIKDLKLQGHTIILLTNANHRFFERFIFPKFPWFKDLFDKIVISSIVKMIKPHKEIYLHALKEGNVEADQAVFIDDGQRNVDGAEAVGIAAILFKNTQQLKEDLKKYL